MLFMIRMLLMMQNGFIMLFDKYIWRFAEWCLNTPLLEMASERNEKMSKIESKNRTINEHLFKWFLMPNSRDRDHWMREIDDRFFEISNFKWGKNKKFKSDEYFNLIYNRFYLKDMISLDIRRINRSFNEIETRYSSEYQIDWDIDNFIERIGPLLKEICYLLESSEYDFDELDKLMNKYLR